jgi:hypothetical protein
MRCPSAIGAAETEAVAAKSPFARGARAMFVCRPNYAKDFKAANAQAGFRRTPKGNTWHHLDDYDPVTNRGTMQLVEQESHRANQPHSGGVRQYEAATGRRYEWW